MIVNDMGEQVYRRNDKASREGGFLPSGPFIPIDQIPNEIERLLFGKKPDKVSNGYYVELVRAEDIKDITLLAQIALIVFIIVAFVLIFILLFVCILRTYYACRKPRR